MFFKKENWTISHLFTLKLKLMTRMRCHPLTLEIVCALTLYTHTHNRFVIHFKIVSSFISIEYFPPLVLVTKCRRYSVKYDTADYDYKDYIKISDIRNSQPDNYILRIVLFIQGGRDANILLTTSDHPNFERDFVYEIGKLHTKFWSFSVLSNFYFNFHWRRHVPVIGGWGNEVKYNKISYFIYKHRLINSFSNWIFEKCENMNECLMFKFNSIFTEDASKEEKGQRCVSWCKRKRHTR